MDYSDQLDQAYNHLKKSQYKSALETAFALQANVPNHPRVLQLFLDTLYHGSSAAAREKAASALTLTDFRNPYFDCLSNQCECCGRSWFFDTAPLRWKTYKGISGLGKQCGNCGAIFCRHCQKKRALGVDAGLIGCPVCDSFEAIGPVMAPSGRTMRQVRRKGGRPKYVLLGRKGPFPPSDKILKSVSTEVCPKADEQSVVIGFPIPVWEEMESDGGAALLQTHYPGTEQLSDIHCDKYIVDYEADRYLAAVVWERGLEVRMPALNPDPLIADCLLSPKVERAYIADLTDDVSFLDSGHPQVTPLDRLSGNIGIERLPLRTVIAAQVSRLLDSEQLPDSVKKNLSAFFTPGRVEEVYRMIIDKLRLTQQDKRRHSKLYQFPAGAGLFEDHLLMVSTFAVSRKKLIFEHQPDGYIYYFINQLNSIIHKIPLPHTIARFHFQVTLPDTGSPDIAWSYASFLNNTLVVPKDLLTPAEIAYLRGVNTYLTDRSGAVIA